MHHSFASWLLGATLVVGRVYGVMQRFQLG
jgi:hypothetical protein